MLGSEAIAGVLQFEQARNPWAVVMVGESAQGKQRHGIGIGPAPATETNHVLKLGDRLAPDRLTVHGGASKSFDSLPTAAARRRAAHGQHDTAVPQKIPTSWDGRSRCRRPSLSLSFSHHIGRIHGGTDVTQLHFNTKPTTSRV